MYEIERKFLVNNDSWKSEIESCSNIYQGYILSSSVVRVRVEDNKKSVLTIKSSNKGIKRFEVNIPIKYKDAKDLLSNVCECFIRKTRYKLSRWVVDVFEDKLSGLILAEIELDSENEHFVLPNWIGREVTDDVRFYNLSLAINGSSL